MFIAVCSSVLSVAYVMLLRFPFCAHFSRI